LVYPTRPDERDWHKTGLGSRWLDVRKGLEAVARHRIVQKPLSEAECPGFALINCRQGIIGVARMTAFRVS
jgi:hypothetical protein